MKDNANTLRQLIRSKFVRSLFLRVVSIFLIVGVAIIAIVFVSFASELNKNLIEGRQQQLALVESSISARMEEVSSIAYGIGNDSSIFMSPVQGAKYTAYEMSDTLNRYLAGNKFIKFLAYYRLSEPDTLYVSKGTLDFADFWQFYLGLDEDTARDYIRQIQGVRDVTVLPITVAQSGESFIAYTYPLPQFSQNPQAFVLMLIPFDEISPMIDALLVGSEGAIAIYDAGGSELYRKSTLAEELPVELPAVSGEQRRLSRDGREYVMQAQVSPVNRWTYVSVARLSDILSELASKQAVFVALLLGVLLGAVCVMLICIAVQYRPISSLARSVTGGEDGAVIDERALLADTFATLKDDSEQKQRFETAYHEADAASKAKSAFLSSMSHDIRTPMNAIIGMTDIAAKNADDPAYVRECLQKVQVASRYLLDIINNVLDMSRIESGRVELAREPFELPKLVYSLITILNQSMEAKRQRLVAEVEGVRDERLMGDSVRLMQVFMNILSNAVKFTPEGGTIGLRVAQTGPSEAGWAEYAFTFSDTGIGMSPEFVGQVFDRFSRAKDEHVAKTEGTGLGMAIAKNLVEMMGGAIGCQSELGRGTTFTVTMRLELADAQGAAAQASPAGHAGKRALAVGGEDGPRESVCRALKEAGAEADAAADMDAAEALARRAASDRPYALIVLCPFADDPSGARDAPRLKAAAQGADTVCALAMLDPSGARAAETDAWEIARLPLFPSGVERLLAREPGALESGAQDAADAPSFKGARVLVADDNRINREIARHMIRGVQAEAEMAVNGKEALELFRQRPEGYFDLVLMDLQMPVMNGYEATAAIRALDRRDAARVPIYALTGSSFDEDVRQVKESGMDGHMSKPYTVEELCEALSRAARRRAEGGY